MTSTTAVRESSRYSALPDEIKKNRRWVYFVTFKKDDGSRSKVAGNRAGVFFKRGSGSEWHVEDLLLSFPDASRCVGRRVRNATPKGGSVSPEGIGYSVSRDDDLIWFDIDDCIDPEVVDADDILDDRALQLLEFCPYVEKSPSGTGLRGVMPIAGLQDIYTHDFNNLGEHVEIYIGTHAARWLTVTGDALKADKFEPVTGSKKESARAFFTRYRVESRSPAANEPERLDFDGELEDEARAILTSDELDLVEAGGERVGDIDRSSLTYTLAMRMLGQAYEPGLVLALFESWFPAYVEEKSSGWMWRHCVGKALSRIEDQQGSGLNEFLDDDSLVEEDDGGAGNSERVAPRERVDLDLRYIWVSSDNVFVDVTNKTILQPQSVNFKHARETGDTQPVTLLKRSRRLRRADHVGWLPTADETFFYSKREYVNTYNGLAIEPSDVDPAMWIDLCTHIYGEYVELFFDHLAFTVQRPETKITWQWLIIGKYRTGKTSTLIPIQHIFGEACSVIDSDAVDSGWGDYFSQKKVVIVEEVMERGKHRAALFDKLKPRLANDNVEYLNIKGQPTMMQQNLYSIYMFSNEAGALRFNPNENKLFVLKAPDTGWGTPEQFAEYRKAVTMDLPAQVLGFLLRRDVSEFNPGLYPGVTQALLDMCEASQLDYVKHAEVLLNDERPPFHRKVVHFETLRRTLIEAGYGSRMDDSELAAMMTRYDMDTRRIRRVKANGKTERRTLWAPNAMTNDEVWEAFDRSAPGEEMFLD